MATPQSLSLVLNAIAANVAEIIPGVAAASVSIDSTLSSYGCNSIDRADIVWKTLEDLELNIPAVEFSNVTDIRGLAELICRYLGTR
jgi:polyketide biosynthesis acyl carrier protein